MKNITNKIGIILIGAAIGLTFGMFGQKVSLAVIPTVHAQGLSNNSGTGQQLFCSRDFGNFLSIGLDFDGEGFWDYWADIFDIPGYGWSKYSANYCHFSDIDALLKKVDKLRKQLRQAFYACDNKTTSTLTAKYNEMSAELYYVRHFIDTKPFPSKDFDDSTKADIVRKIPNFRTKFMQRMEKLEISQEDSAKMFDKFEGKYEPKLEVYRNCSDPNFDMLIQKLKELVNTFDTIKKLAKRFADTAAKKIKKTQQRIQANPGLLSTFSSTSAGDFFKRAVDFRVNGANIADPTYYDQLKQGFSASLEKNHPGGNEVVGNKLGPSAIFPTVSMNSVAQDILKVESRELDQNLEIMYYAELDSQYRQVGGVGLEQNLQLLKDLESIINETTTKVFPEIKTCTEYILNKQCGGG